MFAVLVNAAAVLVGSLLGILLRFHLSERLQSALMKALALCTAAIGLSSAIGTKHLLCLILSMALGTLLGEGLKIENGIELLGERLKQRFARGEGAESRFAEGFVSASLVFCVGSMTVLGSMEAGINHNYSLIYAKSVLDFITAIAFGAAMGFGVSCSALFVLVFQGALTLLSSLVAPFLSKEAVTEMSAVGGVVLLGMTVNLLGLGREKLRVSNMLPGVFLPLLYFPLSAWLGALLR